MRVSNLMASVITVLLTLPCARARGGLPPALFSLRAGCTSSSNSTIDETHFKVLSQSKVYDGKYRQIISKRVEFPNNGKINEFEVLSNHGLPSVTCFCWDVKNKCTTLVKEYHPGPEKYLWGTINGQYEESQGGKHSSPAQCAAFELAEEAELEAPPDNFVPMLGPGSSSGGMPMDKYTDNRFFPFLVLNPSPVAEVNRREQDEEEFIEVASGLNYHDVMELIGEGKINLVSTYTILLGFKTLDSLGIEYK